MEIGVDDVDEDGGEEEDGGDGEGNWVEYESEVLKGRTLLPFNNMAKNLTFPLSSNSSDFGLHTLNVCPRPSWAR